MSDSQLSIPFGVQTLRGIVAAAYDFLEKEAQHADYIAKVTELYVRGLHARFSEVKVFGMSKPQPLLGLYVRANILEKITSRMGLQVEDLEGSFDLGRRSFGKKTETKDGEDIANQLQRFIVLGKPGAGKTTYLRYLTLAMIHSESRIVQRRFPVFITLRDWADKKCALIEYLREEFKTSGFEQVDLFVKNLLEQGNCLVLFDGLDEVSQEANLDGILCEIRDFTTTYHHNQFVMSCRVAAYNHSFERFTDVEMAEFNEAQIETFVRNWFSAQVKTAGECLSRLKNMPQLRDLASNPLLLTLLCISFDDNNDFPNNRAELYKDAIEALLRKWDSSRRIRRDDPYKQLSLQQKENMFARIAYGTFSENRYFIREEELTKMIGNFIVNLPALKIERVDVDSVEVLRSIESNHGIFVERAKRIHSFAHLTFQEYFTARYIVDNDNSQNRILEQLVQQHLQDDKWNEVFLLVAGMLSDADVFLLLTLKKNRELLREPILNNLVRSATQALLSSESKYSKEARKARVIFFVLDLVRDSVRVRASIRALTHDLVFDSDLVSALYHANYRSRALAPAIDLKIVLARTDNFVFARDLALARDHVHVFDLDFDLIRECAHDFVGDLALTFKSGSNRTIEIVEKITTFLSGNIRIVHCLNAAAYCSKSIREYVLSRILAPLEEEEGG